MLNSNPDDGAAAGGEAGRCEGDPAEAGGVVTGEDDVVVWPLAA